METAPHDPLDALQDGALDGVQAYLNEIGRVRLLTAAEEVALAEQSRTIRLPVHMSDAIGQVKRAADRLAQALGRQPTVEELATALGQPIEKITRVFAAMRQPISLETKVGEDGEGTLGALIEDTAQDSPAAAATQTLMRVDVATALEALTERERTILTLRYGLVDGQPRDPRPAPSATHTCWSVCCTCCEISHTTQLREGGDLSGTSCRFRSSACLDWPRL